MKKLIYILLALWAFYGCQDDDAYFETSIPAENLSFTPIPGGAIMHYKLPSDGDILYIRVRYEDAFGKAMICSGSYACDSLVLLGFNEAQKGVPARVTLCNNNDLESEPVDVTFDTKDSGPVSFFEHLEVYPAWGSICLNYDIKEESKGMAHVFYVGEDPVSKQPDTLLINSFVLAQGAGSLQITPQQVRPSYDVVVRTEDFRGYMVKEKVWQNVEPLQIEKLNPVDFDFYDPENFSIEDPVYRLGKSYLFDGDLKGESCFGWEGWDNFCTYLSKEHCLGKPLFIIDMKEQKLPAEFRLYAMLYVRTSFPMGPSDWYPGWLEKYGDIWTSCYASKLPSSVTVYGSNDMADDASWEEIVHFEQDRKIDNELRWCKRCNDGDYEYEILSLDALSFAEPCYMRLSCPVTGNEYRYVKFVINEVFYNPAGFENVTSGSNYNKHVTIHELEIYTAK